MLSIAESLFPEKGHCEPPCLLCINYTPCEQYSDCSQVPQQICAPVLCSRFRLVVNYLLVVFIAGLLHAYLLKANLLFKGPIKSMLYDIKSMSLFSVIQSGWPISK